MYYNFLDSSTSMTTWIIFGVLIVIVLVVAISRAKGRNSSQASDSDNQSSGNDKQADERLGYYRWQEDTQHVAKRNEEQQKIFEEYFVIKKVGITALKIIGILAVILGVILIILGFSQSVMLWLGVVIVIAGIILFVVYSKTRKPKKVMTDEEYEKLVVEHIRKMNIAQTGLKKLGLDPEQVKEIKPIVLRDGVWTGSSLFVYNPQNHSIHFSTQYVILLYFTDEQLFAYKVQFDMCCNMQEEWTSEFFYQDICDVSSHEARNTLAWDGEKIEYSTIEFAVISTNSQIGFSMEGSANRLNSLQAMKHKIRDKKSQISN